MTRQAKHPKDPLLDSMYEVEGWIIENWYWLHRYWDTMDKLEFEGKIIRLKQP